MALLAIIGFLEIALQDGLRLYQAPKHVTIQTSEAAGTGGLRDTSPTSDPIGLGFSLAVSFGLYGFFANSWITAVVLDPGNRAMEDQPINVFIFLLLLIPIIGFVAPYPIQKKIRSIPRWAHAIIICVGIASLLMQGASIFMSAFAIAVTTIITGAALLFYRGAKDKNFKVSGNISLATACVLIAVVIFGWSWRAATAGCLIVEPRPLDTQR